MTPADYIQAIARVLDLTLRTPEETSGSIAIAV